MQMIYWHKQIKSKIQSGINNDKKTLQSNLFLKIILQELEMQANFLYFYLMKISGVN